MALLVRNLRFGRQAVLDEMIGAGRHWAFLKKATQSLAVRKQPAKCSRRGIR
jgi:hypothetical protein